MILEKPPRLLKMVISYTIITHSFIQKDLMSEDKKTRLEIAVLKLLADHV